MTALLSPLISALLTPFASLLLLSLGPLPAPAPSGGGVWPLQPPPHVERGFDPPTSPWGAGHRGVDLLGRVGQVVHAAEAGRVSFVGRIAGVAIVVVDHGVTRTTYEPVTPAVSVGDRVRVGEPIGHLALFGSHCFPRACLHWGLIEGAERYLDPLSLVGGGPIVLLPLSGGDGGFQLPVAPRHGPTAVRAVWTGRPLWAGV